MSGLRYVRICATMFLGLNVAACSTLDSINRSLFGGGPSPGQAGYVKGFIGEVVADESRAALTGKEVLSAGGNAADAAVAVGLSLAVTLPSRAGLGGGGACITYAVDSKSAAKGVPEAIMFVPPPAQSLGRGDRPAAAPMMARGMYLLHARYGRMSFGALMTKAEQLARLGVPASAALTRDLYLVAGPLFADPAARAIFGPGGQPLAQGQGFVQPELAATMAQLRVAGVGDLYQGSLGRRIQQNSPAAGVPIGLNDLRVALPVLASPVTVNFGDDRVTFPPTDGGIAAAASLIALKSQPADAQGALLRGLAASSRWRMGGLNSDQLLSADMATPASVPLYPATTTFATLDRDGNAVVCALTMNNLFGTGRMIPGVGFLAAASPSGMTPPLLAAGLAWNENSRAFHAAVGGSGQSGAGLATALALSNSLRSGQAMPNLVPDPGRANIILCSRYLPGAESGCTAVADPRDYGLAIGGN